MTSDELLSYLRDAAQGASNSAASNVSGPVDLLAWLLRKGGVPVPQNALGGSQWMAEKGLTAQPKNALAGMAGETLGMVGPIVAAAKAPQIANALLKVGENAAARPMLNPQTGAIVWHGSPHKFDAFDSSKIGTGEGAQAYGHGLYLAESPRTAIAYPASLSPTHAAKGEVYKRLANKQTLYSARSDIDSASELAAAIKSGQYTGLTKTQEAAFLKRQAQAVAEFEANKVGNLYKVDLPDEHIAKMLDWDKPLSQQAPEVTNALRGLVSDVSGAPNAERASRDIGRAFNPYGRADLLDEISKRYGWKVQGDTLVKADGSVVPEAAIEAQLKMRQRGKVYDTAGDLYRDLAQVQGSDASISSALRNNGIPGIRYLDGGSRGAGAGTSNYVVFPGNENLLRILERNGVPIGQ